MNNMDEQTTISKEELAKQIAALKEEIAENEKGLMRSLASLMEAIVDEASFKRNDVEFFKTLMAMIRLNRERLQILNDTYNSL